MICETTGLLLPNICPQGQYCATLQLSAVLIVHKVLGVLILVLQMCHNVKPASMVNIVLELVLFLTTKALNVILFTIALYRTLQILLELFWVLLKE